MPRSKISLVVCFCLAWALSQDAFAGKKRSGEAQPEPVRVEGAFYPDEQVEQQEPSPKPPAYDPYLLAGIGGLFTSAIAGGLAFLVAGRRLEPHQKRARAR